MRLICRARQAGVVYECSGRAGEAPSPLGVLDVEGRAADNHPTAAGLLFHCEAHRDTGISIGSNVCRPAELMHSHRARQERAWERPSCGRRGLNSCKTGDGWDLKRKKPKQLETSA